VHEEFGVFDEGLPASVDDDRLVVDLVLDGRTLARKIEALAAQASQTTGLIAHLGTDRYARWVGRESFVAAQPVLAGTGGTG
jgi:hypothetical protein